VFTDVGGADSGGGAVMAVQPPPGVVADGDAGFGWGVGADASSDPGADMEQAVTRAAAQRALIMAASVAGSGLHGRERIR
jgi:outer membrane receptor for monomeric catechols